MRCLLFLLVFITINASARSLITFRVSRPVCLLTFLQTASGNGNMPRTLMETINNNITADDKLKLATLVTQFRQLDLYHTYNIPGYPQGRQRPRTTLDLLMIAAVQSDNLSLFADRMVGVLPNETSQKLLSVLNDADPIYERTIGSVTNTALNRQLNKLHDYENRLNDIFNSLRLFYGSTWTQDMPFTVAVYPVPGNSGNTTATPHSNSLVVAVLTREKDLDMRVAVALHEICHVLYAEQPMVLQQNMDRWFTASKDPNAVYAANYIDEALATACGNAWAYRQLSKKEDTGEWYDNEYINRYAHAIYPLVTEYINAGRSIDSIFVGKAIAIFSKQFPGAYLNYANLLNAVHFYTDAADKAEFDEINEIMANYYKVSRSYGSMPIAESMPHLDGATGTQFFIIHTDHKANYALLLGRFPELKGMNPHEEGVISFFDQQHRPVIIMNVKNKSRIPRGFEAMIQSKAMIDGAVVMQRLN
jgi:hypothetical protein